MTCNCGSGNAANASTTTLSPAPDAAKGAAPDGTPIGKDISKGGTVAAYGSPGGSGVASGGSGYEGGGTQHSTGLGANIAAPNSAVGKGVLDLAKKYESKGDYGAYNGNPPNDPGGASYGAYQIATKTGTMNNFLNQLQKTDPEAYGRLQAAGGNTAAMSGDPAFVNAWANEAKNNPKFADDQDGFIQATHYDPGVAKIKSSTGLDINSQSLAVQQAYASWGIQSPNGSSRIFTQALQGKDVSSMSQADIINTMYDARSNSIGSSGINSSVQNRLGRERQDALNQLNNSSVATNTTTNQQKGI